MAALHELKPYFLLLGVLVNLHLNIAKTTIVPIGDCSVDEWQKQWLNYTPLPDRWCLIRAIQ
eukprot:532715-Amphidinium_carterae.1